ncbi:MAG: TonB-dependent receptor [Cytophagaceae bacterium]|nr:TonB-dependent receptor [Cytophagaceae bacterium]
MVLILRNAFALLVSLALARGFAQNSSITSDTTATELKPVIVVASRLQQTTRETGRNVTIVSGRELSRFPVNSLDDLLRCLPSIEVQSRGSFGAQADITLRGSTFNQVLILLDGMRVNDPLTGHLNGYLPITPAEIEQIEIVRGAGSALYGPDAVGGIINIVTKTFAASRPAETAEVQATVQRGEWRLWNINAGGFWQNQKLRVSGGVLTNMTQGQPLDAPSTRRNDVDLKTYSISANYALTPKLTLAARTAFDRRDFNAQWFYTTSTADLSRETTTRNFYQTQLRFRPNERQQTEFQFAHAYSTDFYVFNPAFTPSSHQMRFTNAQLNQFFQFNDRWKLALGGQYDVRKIESNDRGNHETAHWGLYSVLTAQTAFGLTATGSLRYDQDQSYGGEVLPQLNLSYSPQEKWVLRGSVGKSIRAADFTERYVSNNLPGPLSAGRNIGLANLQAERATNTELGADWMPIPDITLKVTGFLRKGTGLIDYVSLPGTEVFRQTALRNLVLDRSYRLAQNLFDVQTRGVETEIWVKRELGKKVSLDLVGGYTRLNTANAGGVVSQYLANFARHQVTGTLTLTAGRVAWSLSGLYKERTRAAVEAINRSLTPGYKVFHTKLDVAVLPNQLYLTAQVHNLFDERYADILGAQMPRRWVMGGLRWQLRR